VWIAGSLAVAVVAIIVMGSMASRRNEPATQAPPPTASPARAETVAPDEVVLELTADAPIESVRALGMRDVRVRGSRARLVVARWGGELGIDAVLEGGTAAHAVALSDGPHNIALVPVITAPVINVQSASRPPEPRPAARPHAGGGPTTTQPPATPTSELQSNPYGP
jgi:hypothetical protein